MSVGRSVGGDKETTTSNDLVLYGGKREGERTGRKIGVGDKKWVVDWVIGGEREEEEEVSRRTDFTATSKFSATKLDGPKLVTDWLTVRARVTESERESCRRAKVAASEAILAEEQRVSGQSRSKAAPEKFHVSSQLQLGAPKTMERKITLVRTYASKPHFFLQTRRAAS